MAERTLAQVESEITAKNAAIDTLKGQLRVLNAERDRLYAADFAARRVAAMGAAEREAMKSALGG